MLQTDKQRIIWAYKILFLDVLFPLNLRKVIFVDSDQIIRADFAELWNMDLQVCPSHCLSPLPRPPNHPHTNPDPTKSPHSHSANCNVVTWQKGK